MDRQSVLFEFGQVQNIPRHTHTDLEIFFLLKGNVIFELDGTEYNMRENDTIICNSMQVRAATSKEHNMMLRLTINRDYLFRETDELDFLLRCNSCDKLAYQKRLEYEQVSRLLRRMLLLYYQGRQNYSLQLKSVLLQLLAVLREHFHLPVSSNLENTAVDLRIQTITQQIKLRYREELSLQEFARQEHFSLHYLSRLFKKKLGRSFSEYVNELRLAAAVHDLLHTKDSIVKIALNNGFASSSRFTKLFLKAYNSTPAKYRATRSIKQNITNGPELAQLFVESDDLIKYLRQFETKHHSGPEAKCSYKLYAQSNASEQLHLPGIIVRAGSIQQLLKLDVQNQLKNLIPDIKISCVHFRCLFKDGMYSYDSNAVYANFEYYQAFDFLMQLKLSPYLQLAIEQHDLTATLLRLENFLHAVCSNYPRSFLELWKFELLLPMDADYPIVQQSYQALAASIHSFFPNASIGLYIADTQLDNQLVLNNVQQLISSEHHPDSLSLYLDYIEHQQFAEDIDYQQFKHIAATQVASICQLLQASDRSLPIELQQWNTLSGFVTAESNSFYRCALFLDELTSLPKQITHVGLWLNTYLHEATTGSNRFDTISLYLFDTLKRPVYFALCLLDMLYADVVYRQDYLLCSKNQVGDLSILIINPCYFDPQKSSDRTFVESQRRGFDLQVSKLLGSKVIECYHLNNCKSALYDHWANMGFPALLSRSVVNQLRQLVHMDYSIYTEQLNGTYDLSLPLNFNEAALIRIRSNDQPL